MTTCKKLWAMTVQDFRYEIWDPKTDTLFFCYSNFRRTGLIVPLPSTSLRLLSKQFIPQGVKLLTGNNFLSQPGNKFSQLTKSTSIYPVNDIGRCAILTISFLLRGVILAGWLLTTLSSVARSRLLLLRRGSLSYLGSRTGLLLLWRSCLSRGAWGGKEVTLSFVGRSRLLLWQGSLSYLGRNPNPNQIPSWESNGLEIMVLMIEYANFCTFRENTSSTIKDSCERDFFEYRHYLNNLGG